jgi:hypothetical protein
MSCFGDSLAAKGVKGQTNGRNRVALPFGNSFSTAISQIEDQSDEPLRKRRFFGGSAFSRYAIHSSVD